MSRSHINKPVELPPRIPARNLVLGLAIFLTLIAALFLLIDRTRMFPDHFETANGRILEIRKVVDGQVDSQYGGRMIYGVEAHVQYTTNGKSQNRWLRVSDNMPRETLLLRLTSNPKECIVYWPPKQPENARCWIEPGSSATSGSPQ